MLFIARFLIVAFLFSTAVLLAQPCGTDQRHQWKMEHDAAYRQSYIEIQNQVSSYMHTMPDHGQRRSVVTIPVVVHVIHLGEPEGTGSNISANQIAGAIQGLNDRFRNLNGKGVDLEVEFCLANTDSSGNPTSGIIRVDGSAINDFAAEGISFNGGGGANEFAVQSKSIWNHLEYYNIWVVHAIYGDPVGYAASPTIATLEGAVMEAQYMTGNSEVLAHEMGHAFNLLHTFEGWDPLESTCRHASLSIL